MDVKIAFGIYVAQERIRRGLSQMDVARRAGITQAHLSKIERGQREPGVGTALKLCEVLGLNISDFIDNFT